jgi:hypothetical protein
MKASLPQMILPIKLERSEERLTSLSGLLVVEELAQALGVWAEVDRGFEGPKSGRGYEARDFVRPLVWMLQAGGRRLEDLRELRAEPEVLKELGLKTVPDAGTVGDWLRRHGERGVESIEAVSQRLARRCLERESGEVTLDLDATPIEAEKQEAAWTYQGVKGYMPLLGYAEGICVGAEFRPGNTSPGADLLALARRCEAVVPEGRKVYFRSDSAAYQAAILNHYSQPGRSFSITADLDAAVKREIQNLPEAAWQAYRTADDRATDRQIAQTVHTMNDTEQAFRLIVLRWPNPQPSLFESSPYCYHAVATNREGPASEAIWKHNRRGQCENWHKELKLDLGMEQMPCGQLEANALYFAIGVLAYNLAQMLKRQVLPESYRRVTVATLRWKVYRIAGKLVRHARAWVLQVKVGAGQWQLLESARRRCAALAT